MDTHTHRRLLHIILVLQALIKLGLAETIGCKLGLHTVFLGQLLHLPVELILLPNQSIYLGLQTITRLSVQCAHACRWMNQHKLRGHYRHHAPVSACARPPAPVRPLISAPPMSFLKPQS